MTVVQELELVAVAANIVWEVLIVYWLLVHPLRQMRNAPMQLQDCRSVAAVSSTLLQVAVQRKLKTIVQYPTLQPLPVQEWAEYGLVRPKVVKSRHGFFIRLIKMMMIQTIRTNLDKEAEPVVPQEPNLVNLVSKMTIQVK